MIDSKICNCILENNGNGEPMFHVYNQIEIHDNNHQLIHQGGIIIANLTDYAIIPKQKYESLQYQIEQMKLGLKFAHSMPGITNCTLCGTKLKKLFGNIPPYCPICEP